MYLRLFWEEIKKGAKKGGVGFFRCKYKGAETFLDKFNLKSGQIGQNYLVAFQVTQQILTDTVDFTKVDFFW